MKPPRWWRSRKNSSTLKPSSESSPELSSEVKNLRARIDAQLDQMMRRRPNNLHAVAALLDALMAPRRDGDGHEDK